MAVLRIHAPVLGRQERVLEWDGRPLTVGRDETCDVVLLEQAASRHHARLERRGDAFMVTDLGSANGVWVGLARVEGSAELHDGDVVRIGDTTLALVLDPHRQPTLYRTEGGAPRAFGSSATVPQAEPAAAKTDDVAPPVAAPEATAAAVPSRREEIGSEPTIAASVIPEAAAPLPPLAAAPDPSPPPFVPLRPPTPTPSSPSAYSLGSEPTLAAQSGPNLLGPPDRSSPSSYSLGSEPTLAAQSGPNLLGLPDRSSPSSYSLGSEPPLPTPEPEAFGPHPPSSGSVYSLGHEALPTARGPETFSGEPPPHALGLHVASSGSVYLLGDAPLAEFRGPDVLPPAPAFDGGAASSFELGAAPPRPGFPPAPPPTALPVPPAFEPPHPPAFVAPSPGHSAASSWEWSEPAPDHHHRRHGRPAGPTLWLGLGLFIGGVLAMIIALAAGFVPRDLASLLGTALDLGASP